VSDKEEYVKIEVTLSIGFAGAEHKDVLEIHKDEWDACLNQDQREELMNDYWKEWSYNYIDGGYKLLDNG